MEFVAFIILVGIPAFIIYSVVKGRKDRKEKVAASGAADVFTALHVEGLGIGPNTMCDLYRFEDRILIDTKPQKYEIRFENLRAAVVKNEQELIEKGKSVVGRAVIGTLLVPGLGTIVGGMSGIGTKKKKGKTNYFLILNYINAQGDMSAATFKNNLNLLSMQRFCKDINQSSTHFRPSVIEL